MRSVLIILAFIFFSVHMAIPAEWYENGTLHRASVQKWVKAILYKQTCNLSRLVYIDHRVT